MRMTIGGIAVILAVAGCSSNAPTPEPSPTTASLAPVDNSMLEPIVAQAGDISQIYRLDPAQAGRTFAGRRITVRGTVLASPTIEEGVTDLRVGSPGRTGFVSLYSEGRDGAKASKFRRGKRISATCAEILPPPGNIIAIRCENFTA